MAHSSSSTSSNENASARSRAASKRPFRLSPHVRPERYTVALALDPTRSRNYHGHVRIELTLARAVTSIELHAVDLKVSKARVHAAAYEKAGRPAKLVAVPDHESVRIELSATLPKGRAVLELDFSGKLRSDLRGFYFAKSGDRAYAFTQLEAADARRFFPCFDEPSFKARFVLEVTAPKKLTVLSNSPIGKKKPLGVGSRPRLNRSGALQTTTFEPTPLLSTYLVALAVGELQSSTVKRAGRVPIRVWFAPASGMQNITAFALEAAAQCLIRLERYFGVPYPYAKLDLVAVPDFEMGAMENAGAVFFRETLLLIDKERATLPEKKRAIEVICHELAHMWYGNLVTMAWWDDLWLNEAFATWMAFEIVHQWQPELRMWNDFGHSRASALDLDALKHTHAIYTPVKSAAEATESFDLITYEKGASVIRMLERYLGPSRFRRGVRDYIRKHANGNAKADDLWRALERHAGDDVANVVRPWIERPGFPVVEIAWHGGGKREGSLQLTQSRFSARGPKRASGAAKPERKPEAPWPVPVVLRDTRKKTKLARCLLREASQTLPFPARGAQAPVIYANADEGGFYHPLYGADAFASLLEHIDDLSSVERLGFVTHTWALSSAGYMPLQSMVDLALALRDERDPDVLGSLGPPLWTLTDRLALAAGAEAQRALKSRIAQSFGGALSILGLHASASEPVEQLLRRSELLEIVGGIAEDDDALDQACALGARYLTHPAKVEPNVGGVALSLAARFADRALHKKFLARSKLASTPQERRRFRMALAEARDTDCIEATLKLCLTDKIPTQDVALVLARLCENPAARALTFEHMQSDWPKLSRRLTPALAGRFVEATRALQTHVSPRELLAFLRKASLPGTTRALSQLEERLELDQALLKRAARELWA